MPASTGLPDPERHVAGVVATLESGGLTVDVGERTSEPDCVVVHLIPGGGRDGSLQRPNDDVGYVIQTSCVSADWRLCLALWSQAEALLLDGNVDVDGRGRAFVDVHTHGQLLPDHSVKPRLWTATPRWLVTTSPA